MYRVEKEQIEIEGSTLTVYGIADEKGFIFDFTTELQKAEETVTLLNENNVEHCHVADIIEDIIYT